MTKKKKEQMIPKSRQTEQVDILDCIYFLWRKYPQLRLMQLLCCVNATTFGLSGDGFYLRDQELLQMLEKFSKENE
jgi:hypothetical protein